PIYSPAITTQLAVLSHYAVAGDRQRGGIGGAGPCDRSRRLRVADALRDLAVGARLAEWDPLQLLPYSPLECGRPYVEWQVEIGFAPIEIGEDGAHPTMELAALVGDDACRRKLADEFGLERGVGVAERDAAHAALGRGDEELP